MSSEIYILNLNTESYCRSRQWEIYFETADCSTRYKENWWRKIRSQFSPYYHKHLNLSAYTSDCKYFHGWTNILNFTLTFTITVLGNLNIFISKRKHIDWQLSHPPNCSLPTYLNKKNYSYGGVGSYQ